MASLAPIASNADSYFEALAVAERRALHSYFDQHIVEDDDLVDYPRLRQAASPRLLSRRALLDEARTERRVTPAEAATPAIRKAVAEAEKALERA